ncbi:VanW family protein [Planococcus sp. CP5-4]|uniref:VanW family protein n=1 Tax=unclassified Planococcus (in: firmicutes) TaxID=2662419 RepID=UPI001C249986|nr:MULTISPECIES: VanW family protein [unclassified Planococcus (in: firmicutes)]MBU9672904.1 VanW family protein [Planococcus sp. CP5-4_YE]MBV0908676.1 VanW family protein [Planococcus sp. CP5-4_UN]MBW6063445.1 VanW family protein [Planococcus sp. CP5-4]
MDNKVFGLTFLAVLASAMFFFGIANAGSYAVDNLLFSSEEYGDNTYIGTTDVSNMEVASAVSTVSSSFDSWKQNAALFVRFQDATAKYPLKHVEALVEETTSQAQSGQQNNVVINLPEAKTRSFLESNFPEVAFSETDIQSITSTLERALAAGQTETRVDISDDSLTAEKLIVSETSFPHDLASDGANLVIEELDGMQIAPESQFSLLAVLAELNAWDITDAELTEIASVIYSTVLKTNLLIDERSIGATQPASIPLGFEAAISQDLAIDLAFTNPNHNTFTLNVDKAGEMITASLTALPFVYDYSVQTGGETEIEPRLIKQYSAFVSSGTSVKENGADGARIEVSRAVFDDNEELEVEPVSTDFYPPVHRVEVYPLETPDVASPGDAADPAGEDAGNPDAEQEQDGVIVEDPKNPGFDLDGYPIIFDENGDIVQNGQNDSGSDAGSDSGNANSNEENGGKQSEEPVYDKSGKLINP